MQQDRIHELAMEVTTGMQDLCIIREVVAHAKASAQYCMERIEKHEALGKALLQDDAWIPFSAAFRRLDGDTSVVHVFGLTSTSAHEAASDIAKHAFAHSEVTLQVLANEVDFDRLRTLLMDEWEEVCGQ